MRKQQESASDHFERSSLGSDWTVHTGIPAIVKSNLGLSFPGLVLMSWTASTFASDQYCEAVISPDINLDMLIATVYVRRRENGARYGFIYHESQFIVKYDGVPRAETRLLVAKPAPPPKPGDTLRIEICGFTIKGFHNGTEVVSVTDTDPSKIVSGQPGLGFGLKKDAAVNCPAPVWERWEGGSLQAVLAAS